MMNTSERTNGWYRWRDAKRGRVSANAVKRRTNWWRSKMGLVILYKKPEGDFPQVFDFIEDHQCRVF